MSFCECGCGQEIIIKKYHKWYGIPEYIKGHHKGNLGKKHTPEAIEKIRQAHNTPEAIEKIRQSNLGKKHTPEAIEKIRQANLGKKLSPETIEKMRQAHNTPEAIEKTRQSNLGEKNPNFNDWASRKPYCKLFSPALKEEIRNRDNRICQNCDKTEIENKEKLSVHHIHYDKENCYPDLITLCRSCNSKVNSNCDYWEDYFMKKLKERNLLNYFGDMK